MAIVNSIPEQRNLQCNPPSVEVLAPTYQNPKAKFRHWAETTNKIVLIVQNSQVQYMNPAAEDAIGFKTAELLSNHFDQLLLLAGSIQIQQCGSIADREIEITTKSGEQRWLNCTFKVRQFAGKPALVAIATDITQQKQAAELGARKTCLVSMLAHELRSPLNIISFSTSLLQRHSDRWNEEKKRPYLDRIQTAVEQLNQLMEEVLVLGQAEAGKLTWKPEELNLEQFCRELLAQLHLSYHNQRNFTFVSQGNCSKVSLDRKLLQPILTNLLDNAVKYSPFTSTVHLEICCRDGTAIFQVKDNGIGIPIVEQQRLFEPFYRCENIGDTPGAGLGLAVVKQMIGLHGGLIDVLSQVGVGSTFTVTLPCRS